NLGIGRATALAFANGGCRSLALLDKNLSGAQETQRQVMDAIKKNDSNYEKAKIHTYEVDVTSDTSVASAFKSVKETFGRLDYSVQCAGIALFTGPSSKTSLEHFELTNSILYRGLWLCSRAALEIMDSQELDSKAYPSAMIPEYRAQCGSIINLSSGLALLAQHNSPIYSAAKAAVLGLTRADAVDYCSKRIRVNAVLPGLVDTPMINSNPEVHEVLKGTVKTTNPMARFATADELADAIVFLASNKASYITGASICVDGGTTARA
ncbi:3-oxoacyl-reductase, partial [Corynespora cassiicola Philippines]